MFSNNNNNNNNNNKKKKKKKEKKKNLDIDVEVVEGAIQSDYWCVSLLLNGKYSSLTHCERYLFFLFFSDYLTKNVINLENSFFFFLFERNGFNWNEMFVIWIIFV